MKVTIERITPWSLALDLARNTIGKEEKGSEPSSNWKRKIIAAEHSPIRAVMFHLRFTDLPYWVAVHLTRHKHGVEWFQSTQRTDRTESGIDRSGLRQDAPVMLDAVLNAQAILSISRRRLCRQASPETRAAWNAVVKALYAIGEEELADACVAMCAYRGGLCNEIHPCGLCVTR